MNKTPPVSAFPPPPASPDRFDAEGQNLGVSSPPAQAPSFQGPALCGNVDIRIAADGTWYYGGSPIGRKQLVKLFSSVLCREDDDYWLVTPVEKARIQVDDAPFLGVELIAEDGGTPTITIRTNVDDIVTVDEAHPLRIDNGIPYVTVRGGLEAKLSRAVYYELVNLGVTEVIDGKELFGLWSTGTFFPMGSLDDSDAEQGAPS